MSMESSRWLADALTGQPEKCSRAVRGAAEANRTRRSYETVAHAYAAEIADELAGKPLDRGLLDSLAELAAGGIIGDIGCGPGHVTS